MKKVLSWLLIVLMIGISINSAYAFPFFKKGSRFPSKDFRSYLFFQNNWKNLPKVFWGMTRDEVIQRIQEPSESESFKAFSMDKYGKTGFLYLNISYSMLKLTGFSFTRFSPVLGNRISEGYARQAGWVIKESSSGKRYMEREITDWSGNAVPVVHFLEGDLEIFLEKEEAEYLELID